jgi:hypothetical protein
MELGYCLLPFIPESFVFSSVFRTIILALVLYGSETWSLTLREKHEQRMSENRLLRRLWGLKEDEVMECWRELHNEQLCNFYSLSFIIRMTK